MLLPQIQHIDPHVVVINATRLQVRWSNGKVKEDETDSNFNERIFIEIVESM